MMDTAPTISKKVRLIILLVVVLLLTSVIFGIVSAQQRRGKIVVELKAAPKQATMTIGGKNHGTKVTLSPGTHAVIVAYDGFKSYKKELVVSKGDPKQTLTAALSPLSAEAKKIAATQAELYTEIENLSGKQSQKTSEEFFEDNPILRNIPSKTSYYSIDYGKDASGDIQIQITAAQPVGRQVAIEKIRSWGYDPSDFKIVFVGFNNPFPRAVN